jgi:hypothetical protein
MRRFSVLAAVAAFALVLQGRASAQTTPPPNTTYAFVTVDAVSFELRFSRLNVTGILEGEQAPVKRSISFASSAPLAPAGLEACSRFAALAMEKPGAYRLELLVPSYSQEYPTCTLVRVNP